MKIILASASPRRKELLSLLGVSFRIEIPNVKEVSTVTDPKEYVLDLAKMKGLSLGKKYQQSNTLVIAADTIVAMGEKILEKPKDEDDAYKKLTFLSGKTHCVYTAIALFYKGEVKSFYEETQVSFYKLDDKFIKKYIASGEPMDKAGAYGIQGLGQVMVKSIKGNYANVVGLPTSRLYQELKNYRDGSELF